MAISKKKELDRLREVLSKLSLNLDGTYAVRASAVLEDAVEDAIRLRMPCLSKTMAESLFTGYGPLSSFSAKIDIAHAYGYISEVVKRDLHAVRQLRNAFAHPKGTITFDSPSLDIPFARFSSYKKGADRWALLDESVTRIQAYLKKERHDFFLIKEMTEGAAKRASSLEKSPR